MLREINSKTNYFTVYEKIERKKSTADCVEIILNACNKHNTYTKPLKFM